MNGGGSHKVRAKSLDWMDGRQACGGSSLRAWFPDDEDRGIPPSTLLICQRCVLRVSCLTYALTSPQEKYGIWGGTTPNERKVFPKLAGFSARERDPRVVAEEVIAHEAELREARRRRGREFQERARKLRKIYEDRTREQLRKIYEDLNERMV